ncbi:phospholipid-transporting ATPase IA-like protein [Sarcoptes scabiei]|uniref:Phospholipid-transporting ATPase n=1 Tax=Sarcoptes scabiei TaxID=52283 RepID=A0A131ZW08_SARSC|nr:phospholipid-transporting ATPase IA-like protein [Sarcoptes scabiei]
MSPSIELRRLSTDQEDGYGQSVAQYWSRFFKHHSSPNSNYRVIPLTGQQQKFIQNSISTAKYNLFSFLPKFLFEQFRKYANIFFLFIALMQQIPNVSPTGKYTTLVPLIFILTVSALKEIFEDIKRHHADRKVNNTPTIVFSRLKSIFLQTKWKKLKVGDLVLVKRGQFFPSDLVIFSSNEPNGICYVETANLDGETNLKARSAIRLIDEICSVDKHGVKDISIENLHRKNLFSSVIHCDLPNKELYEFNGKLIFDGDEYAITSENILLRGAKLRNTEWALGCVIYTGHETKLMMNSSKKAILKQSNVEIMCNRQIFALLGILIVICLISAICSVIWSQHNRSHWYLTELQSQMTANFFLILLTFIILYNNLIPISLQVTLEMVRFIQALFINNDLEMYCDESDTPAMARTSNLNEELGQVRYILSDKTGTITRNVMEFKKCSIDGNIYDETKFDRLIKIVRHKQSGWEKINEFLTLLSVCHTVIPEITQSETGPKYIYQASSPDEAALVKGAQKIGFEFLQRTSAKVMIDAMGEIVKFEVLHILPFNSDRKRMSTIIRNDSSQIKIYTKGADSIIQKRLSTDSLIEFTQTEVNLTTFATDGLRTLCCAYRVINDDYYLDWEHRYNKAILMSASTPEEKNLRDQRLNDIMSEIEDDLTLLGATAIEDKLQEGVPQTIETLMRAGIGIWMLTGDKLETATNISYSCRLLKNIQNLNSYHIVKNEDIEETRKSLFSAHAKLKEYSDNFTLIIDSKSLSYCLQMPLRPIFMDLALKCRSVICCRVSPAQKAEIVDAVKKSTNSITLAIGDGANDVAMIRAAHVGVGISGQEGLQAVYSSDYAIAQFRFLSRLLLVHGSWSFSRVSKLILYSFYKNIALYVIELWFASVSAWSGQAVFERWSIGLYNVIFTAGPPLVIGLFDRICSAEMMLNNPELYQEQSNIFSIKLFWFWIASAIWHSLVLFWMTYMAVSHDALWLNGWADGGYLCFGNILYTYVVITVCLKAALETNCWTWPTHLAIWGSIASWFLFIWVYSKAWPTLPIGADMANIDRIIFTTSVFWIGMAVIPLMALLVDIIIKLVTRTCFKSLTDRIVELELAKKMQQQPPASFSERARLLINNFLPAGRELPPSPSQRSSPTLVKSARLPSCSSDLERDALHGYSFSQEERDPSDAVSHSKVICMYNTRLLG